MVYIHLNIYTHDLQKCLYLHIYLQFTEKNIYIANVGLFELN